MTDERFPVGDEWRRPVKLTATSATERAAFRRCRRQWFLTQVHRLESQEDNLNFWIGELVHTGLEAYYRAVKEEPTLLAPAEAACLDAYEAAYEAAIDKARSGPMGIIWGEAGPMYEELGSMGFGMLQGYLERERLLPIGDEVVEVEVRRFVPILDPKGRKVGRLSVRTDLVVRRKGVLRAVDHKTATQHLSPAMLDIDDQLTAEVYIVWKELGEFPEEAVYNSLAKKVPGPPKRNQDKKGVPQLSKAKGQATTSRLYREEVERLGLDLAEYADIIQDLEDQEAADDTPFFYREATFRTPGQMASFEANLFQEFRDMREVAAHPERAYPSPSTFACPSCPVRAVCLVMMDGGDPTTIVQNEYTLAEPRY